MNSSTTYFFRFFALATEFILINLACKLAYFLKYGEYGSYEDYYVSFFLIFTLAWAGASLLANSYDPARLGSLKAFLRSLILTVFLHLFIIALYIVSVKAAYLSRLYLIYTYSAAFFSIVGFRSLLILAYRYYISMNYHVRKIVMIGEGRMLDDLEGLFNPAYTTVYRFLDQIPPDYDRSRLAQELSGMLEHIKAFCLQEQVNEIYLALPAASEEAIDELFGFADDNFIYFRIVTDFNVLRRRQVNVSFYGHIPVISLRREPLKSALNRVVKRGFDVAFSLGVIVLIFPWLYPLIALCIRLDSPGPVLFTQLRSGRNNRLFKVYKFRTMHVNAEADQRQATRGDKRVTRVGQFLRRSSLDELPQFINVLLGDMSVVGPRPHMVKHTSEYASVIDNYLLRHFITPGITGHAQVNGYRGETRDPLLMQKRVEYDTWYIENWSLLLDLKIILQTTLLLWKDRNRAY
jgi:putative colanic acid biosynthesis UDP-glucose lipid carrier transferase